MKHPAVRRIDWPALVKRAENIKPIARSMTGMLEDAANEIGRTGILAEIAAGRCYPD